MGEKHSLCTTVTKDCETSSTQADEPTQSCSEESHEPQTFQEPEQEEVVSGACDGEEEHVQIACLNPAGIA
ncbi:hypothetical protein JOQ06_018652 [Pogonophryne albipinna]|uniref:Uncharacterized protein n=1 Tax=Pogonophryne albipinna TaxID=1090488 RepID=A0AAD6AQ09_9TELE|nr:hypothetical protein JOQ06_018652 [Pogonophryne albipinna]